MIGSSVDLRYGLTDRIEIETRLPYLFRRDEVTFQDSNDDFDGLRRFARRLRGVGNGYADDLPACRALFDVLARVGVVL